MSDAGDLAALLDLAWQRLGRGLADRRAPARHPVLATVSRSGWPEARTVVLRGACRVTATLEMHSDAGSAKLRSLAHRPRAELLVWDPRPALQIRIAAKVTLLQGAAAADRWTRVPAAARAGYGRRPAPGTPIAGPHAYDSPGDAHGFAVLTCRIVAFDLLHLGTRHRRAAFHAVDDWRGQWCAP